MSDIMTAPQPHQSSRYDFSLLNYVSVPAFALEPDPEGRPVYAAYNQSALDVTGLTLDHVIGRTATEVHPGRYGEAAYDRHCQAFASRQAQAFTLTRQMNDGEMQVHTELKPVFGLRGAVTHVVGTSQVQSTRQGFETLRSHAQLMDSETEQFISLAAHDLRSPLRRITALAGILRRELNDSGGDGRKVLNMLEQVASTSMSLITDVISHAQATSADASMEKFNLQELCEELMVMLDPSSRHIVTVGGSWVRTDRIATQVILRNLLDNAIKNNQERPLVITIELTSCSEQQVEISVSDNGPGLSHGADELFNNGKLRSDSGYGLMGIKRLVDSRGGTISAHNADFGSGATFRFSLPGQVMGLGLRSV